MSNDKLQSLYYLLRHQPDGEIASFEAYQQDGTNIERDEGSSPLCNTTPVPVFLRDLVYKYQKVDEDFHLFDSYQGE